MDDWALIHYSDTSLKDFEQSILYYWEFWLKWSLRNIHNSGFNWSWLLVNFEWKMYVTSKKRIDKNLLLWIWSWSRITMNIICFLWSEKFGFLSGLYYLFILMDEKQQMCFTILKIFQIFQQHRSSEAQKLRFFSIPCVLGLKIEGMSDHLEINVNQGVYCWFYVILRGFTLF
jgi:hypothetical protein